MKAILTYHSIDATGSVVSVSPQRFRSHVELLEGRGVPVVSIPELLSSNCREGAAITFDDGFENLASVAWPILRAAGFTATVFVATDWIGRENGWDRGDARIPRLPLLGWAALSELVTAGLAIGSHSRSHARLTTLSDAQLRDELEGSRASIAEETGVVASLLAYPYGDHDGRVSKAAERAGYTHAVTTELRAIEAAPATAFTLPRLDAYYLARPGVMELWGTAGMHRYLRFRRVGRRARETLRRVGLAS